MNQPDEVETTENGHVHAIKSTKITTKKIIEKGNEQKSLRVFTQPRLTREKLRVLLLIGNITIITMILKQSNYEAQKPICDERAKPEGWIVVTTKQSLQILDRECADDVKLVSAHLNHCRRFF